MKNQNNKKQSTDLLAQILEGTQLAESKELDITLDDNICIIHKAQMTALEVAEVIDTLEILATELTVILAGACGLCDNCSFCRELLDGSQKIQLPDYVLEDAGILKDAKLEAFSADYGEIVVTEAEYQKDINDVSPGIISVLVTSGICLAELDELIMQEEIIYGE